MWAAIPQPTHEKRRQAIELALADMASHGITSAQDNSQWEDFQVYEELEREGKLTARISEWLPFDESIDELNKKRSSHPASDNMLHTGMLKGFMDGSLGSKTAALFAPYSDDPSNPGLPQYDAAKLNAMTKERVLAGYQIGFHAIGDKGVQMALDAFAEAEKAAKEAGAKAADGGNDYRLRVRARASHHTAADSAVQGTRSNRIDAAEPPAYGYELGRVAPGSEARGSILRLGGVPQRGVTLAFGTDYPVEPVTPFRGIYSALTGRAKTERRVTIPRRG